MKLDFETVDVFTDRQFGGNPLAVISDAQGLSGAQMQAIAAEFNLSETTFVLPPQAAEHTAQVRIFTPLAEMPFAGHPNVGTAFVLAHLDAEPGSSIERRIGQGFAMGRPSQLDALAEKNVDGTITTYIGGTCVPVMRGTLDLDV